jgi:hypothetical protein
MPLKLDFSEVPDYKPIPQGDYLVEVVDVDGPKTSNAGNQMLQLTFEVAEGEFAGRKIYNYFLLLEGDALWRTKKDLSILLGIDEDEESATFEIEDLMGAQALAFVRPEVWKVEDGGDGEARPKIARLKAVEGSVADLFA